MESPRSPTRACPGRGQYVPPRGVRPRRRSAFESHHAYDRPPSDCRRRRRSQVRPNRCAPKDAIRPSRPNLLVCHPVDDGSGFSHHRIMRNAWARIVEGLLHLGTEPSVMVPRLTLALDELVHELAYDLRGRPVHRLGFGRKGIPEIGFQLDREDGFLGHSATSYAIIMTIPRHYLGCTSFLDLRGLAQPCSEGLRFVPNWQQKAADLPNRRYAGSSGQLAGQEAGDGQQGGQDD